MRTRTLATRVFATDHKVVRTHTIDEKIKHLKKQLGVKVEKPYVCLFGKYIEVSLCELKNIPEDMIIWKEVTL